eukprot:TRINITY_DN2940_c0_g1_i1.p3 TRINITY_DN2940_c0_g1~~TRINITY_DN2940_c0_g1_i1.p3  ORF type:complete len:127 (-),score=29.51 TRINITY_DN2940_c0_g1_i1:146-526(-)
MKTVLAEENKLGGCMVGRAARDNPWLIGQFDKEFYGVANPGLSRKEVVLKYAEYIGKLEDNRYCNRVLINPILNLFYSEKNNELYYKFLIEGERSEKYGNDIEQLIEDSVVMYSEHNLAALNAVHD